MTTFYDMMVGLTGHLPCTQFDTVCGIIAIIIILFIGAFFALLANLGGFARERYQLSILERLLSDIDRGLIRDTAVFYDTVFSRLSQDTLVYERVDIIYSLSQRNLSPSLSDLSELTIAKKDAEFKTQLVNVVITVLLIIGLAGTFWAFREILTNSGISQALSNETLDIKVYKTALDKIYTGFQSAFLASLAGIMGTVLLLLFKFLVVNPGRESFFYQLDYVTQTKLIPLFAKPNQLDQVAEILTTTTTEFGQVVNQLRALSQEVKESVTDTKNLTLGLQFFSKQISELTESFKLATGEASPFYQAPQQLIHYFEQVSQNFNQLIQLHQDQLAHSGTQSEQLLKNLGTAIEQFMEGQTALSNKIISKTMANSGAVTKELQILVTELKQQQVDYLTEIQHLSQKTERSAFTMADATERLIEFLNLSNQQAQQTIAQLSEISLGGLAQKVEEKAVAHTQAMLEQLKQMDSLKHIEQIMLEWPKPDQELGATLREIQISLKSIQEKKFLSWPSWLEQKFKAKVK